MYTAPTRPYNGDDICGPTMVMINADTAVYDNSYLKWLVFVPCFENDANTILLL